MKITVVKNYDEMSAVAADYVAATLTAKPDCVLGLALIHHLRVTGNWQTADIVKLFSTTGKYALIEFVPLDDEQMQQLVRGRESIYNDWNIDNVLEQFRREFAFVSTSELPDSGRIMIKLAKEKL